jgi:phosphosulfolactate phosphohydrolase-like enzyme
MTGDAIDLSGLSVCDDLSQRAPSVSCVGIVIDVVRSFTTVAVLIARGAVEVICVREADAFPVALAGTLKECGVPVIRPGSAP